MKKKTRRPKEEVIDFTPMAELEKAVKDAVVYGCGYLRINADGDLTHMRFWDGLAESIKAKEKQS